MTETIKQSLNLITNGVPMASSAPKPLIKIQGTLTSSIQPRGEAVGKPHYYYSFIRLKGQKIDLPVIFKIKQSPDLFVLVGSDYLKPNLKKSDQVELTGYYSTSEKSVRKSFTATFYQLLSEKRIRKKCVGCLDTFTCSQSKNYDYCSSCEINGSRYLNKKSPCAECDGSGLIKFKGQPPRPCKLCYLTNQVKKNIFTKND